MASQSSATAPTRARGALLRSKAQMNMRKANVDHTAANWKLYSASM